MNHLTHEQLSALADGALPAAEMAAGEAHIAGCAVCRAELETLRAADALIGETLTHDPGDAYFASFASRVAGRIEAEGAVRPVAAAREATGEVEGADVGRGRPVRTGSPWWDISSWFVNPARLAWVGGVAAVVVAAGVVLMLSRETGVPDLRDVKPLARDARPDARPQAPAPGDSPPANALESRKQAQAEPGAGTTPAADRQRSDDAARLSTPARLREMRQVPGGEDVPVGRQDVPSFAREPAPAPPAAAPGEPVRIRRPQRAEPLDAAAKQQTAEEKDEARAPEPVTESAKPDGGAAKRALSNLGAGAAAEGEHEALLDTSPAVAGACGTVVDPQGRPLARAQVVLGEGGVVATTGEDGRFCFDVAAGEYDVTVLAVGFTPLRRRVALGDPNAPARLVAQTVDVLPTPAPAPAPIREYALRDGVPEIPAAPATLPADLRQRWTEAGRMMAEATRERSATGCEASAKIWSELVDRIAEPGPRLDAREHHAAALYTAWDFEPTGARAAAAAAALRAFIGQAPDGPRRDRARQRLARLLP